MLLKIIKNSTISKLTKQIHKIQVSPLCPKTGDPIAGSKLSITYVPKHELLEVYRRNEDVASFIGSNEVRDLELFTQDVARDCRTALEVKVTVKGRFVLNIGQSLTCECEG